MEQEQEYEYVQVDLEEVEAFIKNQDFHYYLVNNVNDFNSAVFILQTLLDAVDAAKKQLNFKLTMLDF